MPTKKRQITRYKKTKFLGIDFASKLEAHMYKLLIAYKINAGYESRKFTIIDGFVAEFSCYEKTKTKKYLHDRGNKKVLPITYTPDFVDPNGKWIIEVKGYANDVFPLKWKMFKNHLMKLENPPVLYLPKNQGQVLKTIELIKQL